MQDKVILAAVGDIMPGDLSLYWGIGVKSRIERKGIFIFEHVEKIFSESDVVFGNLESVLSDSKKHSYHNSTLRGAANFVEQLVHAHFNVVNIANNHIQQHGKEALCNTINTLKENHIKVVGTKGLNPQITKIKNIKIGFVGYSLRPEVYADKAIYSKESQDTILSNIGKLKDIVDYLIVSIHWGDEYVSFPAFWQISFAHKLIDTGVDVILGHHPHVLQGIERYKQGIIAYSLGNFVSDMCQEQAKETIILKLIFDNSGISYDVIPCRINSNFQPELIVDKEKSLNNLKKLSHLQIFSKQEYEKSVQTSIAKFRKAYYFFLIRNWHKYPCGNLKAIICDFITRRTKKVSR